MNKKMYCVGDMASMMARPGINETVPEPQSLPIAGRESEMEQSRGGGFAFSVSPIVHIRRFLILGSHDGYYAAAKEITVSAADRIVDSVKAGKGAEIVRLIEEVNTVRVEGGDFAFDDEGEIMSDKKYRPAAAPRKAASLFALAVCHLYGNEEVKREVYAVIGRRHVISTLRQMFDFMNAYFALTGGWGKGRFAAGSGMKRAVSEWMIGSGRKGGDRWLAGQFIKYRNGGYTHKTVNGEKRHTINGRDVLRTYHVKPSNPEQIAVFAWVTKREKLDDGETGLDLVRTIAEANKPSDALSLIGAFEDAQTTKSVKHLLYLINEYNLPHEAIPNTWFVDTKSAERKEIWRGLLGVGKGQVSSMGLTALVRNLPRFSNYGVFDDLDAVKMVIDTLSGDGAAERLIKARVHPIRLLSALRVYGRGWSDHNSSAKWKPNKALTRAIEDAFYKSFGSVEPSNVKLHYGIDVSSSMDSEFGLIPGVTSREAAAVMAMVTAANEAFYEFKGFSNRIVDLPIRPGMDLGSVCKILRDQNFGFTDPSLLIKNAIADNLDIDAFIIITDNDLNSGDHPTQVLNEYREKTGKNSRLVVISTEANEYSIADPTDPLQMDVVGFDATAPTVIADFCAGRI